MTEEVRTESRELLCQLTEKEVFGYGKQLAEATRKLGAVEAERKATASSFKSRIDRIVADMRGLGEKVESGRELRRVDCTWALDYRLGKAELARNDTGEVIEERPLTAEERQPKLPIAEEKNEEGCRVCGCTVSKACQLSENYNCSWVIDEEPPLCDNPECLRKAGWSEERIREEWKNAVPEDLDAILGKPAEASAVEETPKGDGPVFVDDLGRHCQVAFDDVRAKWGAFRVKKNGGLLRIKDVPLYQDRANAEKGLIAFAQKAGFLTLQAHEGLQKVKKASHG